MRNLAPAGGQTEPSTGFKPTENYSGFRVAAVRVLAAHPVLVGFVVLCSAFFVFCSNARFEIASDARGLTASADWIAQGHGLALNDHPAFSSVKGMAGYWGMELPDGRMVSVYPICAAVTAAPFFKLAHMLGSSKSILAEGWIGKWSAASMLAVAVWSVWLSVRRVAGEIEAILVALMLSTGSPFFSTLSQSLWMQTPAIMAHALSLAIASPWLFCRTENKNTNAITKPWLLLLCGFMAAWAAACRPNFGVWTIILCVAAIWQLRRSAIWVLVGAASATVMYLLINKLTYGTISGLYTAKAADVGFKFNVKSTMIALGGLLVSPGRGLLIFCPWTILIFAGLYVVVKETKLKSLGMLAISVFFLVYLLMLAMFGEWWGGWSGGPRLQSDLLITGSILAAFAVQKLLRPWFFVSLVFLILPSFIVQYNSSRLLGYPWEEFAAPSAPGLPDRLWNWKYGNIHWIYARGSFEKQLRQDFSEPFTNAAGFSFGASQPISPTHIQNGFSVDSGRPGHLYSRAQESRIIFALNGQLEPHYALSLTCSDSAPWGTAYTCYVNINEHRLGEIRRLSGSQPSTYHWNVESSMISDGLNTITFEQREPPLDDRGASYISISSLSFVPQ